MKGATSAVQDAGLGRELGYRESPMQLLAQVFDGFDTQCAVFFDGRSSERRRVCDGRRWSGFDGDGATKHGGMWL